MFTQCKQYLVDTLKNAGIQSGIITSFKLLSTTQESHIGAVIFESETLSKSGTKTIFTDVGGDKHKRRKIFDRDIIFSVIIGDYSQEKVEEMYSKFFILLDDGLLIDGNYTSIELSDVEWVAEADSILNAKMTVQIKVQFSGGVYKDTGYKKMTVVNTTVDIERGKNNGNY